MTDLAKIGFASIESKVVFISGASNGIGRATALLLASFGAKLALGARRIDKLEELSKEIVASGAEAPLLLELDVQDEKACDAAVAKTLERFGRIDVLLNNAGVGIPTPDISKLDAEAMETQMKTNLFGLAYLTRGALASMRASKSGHIVNISSVAGVVGNPTAPLYCASKFAVEGFTEGLRKQCDAWKKSEGAEIRVTNVKPGSVNSGYWGDRAVPRETFMTCEEMASVLFWTVAAAPSMNIVEIRMETRR
jgi:NADP-dependent 3-hydroxy acid dehydrogenase YdfG